MEVQLDKAIKWIDQMDTYQTQAVKQMLEGPQAKTMEILQERKQQVRAID